MKNSEQRLVDLFNDHCPVGTPVRYWPVVGEGEGILSKTRSEAWLLSGHTAVVMIEGKSGAVAVSHVEEVKSDQPVEKS